MPNKLQELYYAREDLEDIYAFLIQARSKAEELPDNDFMRTLASHIVDAQDYCNDLINDVTIAMDQEEH